MRVYSEGESEDMKSWVWYTPFGKRVQEHPNQLLIESDSITLQGFALKNLLCGFDEIDDDFDPWADDVPSEDDELLDE